MNREDKGYFIMVSCFIFLVIAGWMTWSYFEAASYNRLTGSHVTVWEAMFVELRVQEGTEKKSDER